MWCLYVNQAAYSNNFSAILRVSRDSNLSPSIHDKNASGVNPDPKDLKNSRVRLLQLNNGDDTSPLFAVKIVQDAELLEEKMEEV
jgi:hypothetical protein